MAETYRPLSGLSSVPHVPLRPSWFYLAVRAGFGGNPFPAESRLLPAACLSCPSYAASLQKDRLLYHRKTPAVCRRYPIRGRMHMQSLFHPAKRGNVSVSRFYCGQGRAEWGIHAYLSERNR